MSLWIIAVAAPVVVSTVVAVSACMLSSRRNRSLEMPPVEAIPDPQPLAGRGTVASGVPLLPR